MLILRCALYVEQIVIGLIFARKSISPIQYAAIRVLPVRPSVRLSRIWTRKQKKCRGTKIGGNVPNCRTNRCEFSAREVKGQADGRPLCRHWADIFAAV